MPVHNVHQKQWEAARSRDLTATINML